MATYTEDGTSRFAEINEGACQLKIHYHDIGNGEPVVMMHGAGPGASGWSNFSRNVDDFVAAGYRVILVDSPGWNKSDPVVISSGYRSDFNAAAVKGLLDVLAIDRAHLVGNSMGGMNALSFALNYPERLGKLVVMGGGGLGKSLFVPGPPEGIKALMGLYKKPTLDNLKAMLGIFVYDAAALNDAMLQERYQNMMAHPDHLENFVKSQVLNAHQFPDYTEKLPRISSPTLVVWGRDDRFMPLDFGLKFLWGLPDADLSIFGRCGHWAQWEHAFKFNRLAIDFLGRGAPGLA